MGKTEPAKIFARRGIPVYDADAAVHRLYQAGGAAVDKIADAFPGSVKGGEVDREELARRLRETKDGFDRLEKIVHPLVGREQQQFLADAAARGADMVVMD